LLFRENWEFLPKGSFSWKIGFKGFNGNRKTEEKLGIKISIKGKKKTCYKGKIYFKVLQTHFILSFQGFK